jgi:uncharacterized protein YjbJ (UPF0337 family)
MEIIKGKAELKASWSEIKRKLKKKFTTLTDNDLLLVGKQNEILNKLQAKLGKTKEELLSIITKL